MTQREESSSFLKPSGERPSGTTTRRRVDPCEGMATPSPPGDSASRARATTRPSYSQLTVDDVLALQAGRVPSIAEDLRDACSSSTGRICAWCTGPVPARARRDALYCGVVCRKRAWRFAQASRRDRHTRPGDPRRSTGRVVEIPAGRVARFAYADPPYPGKAGYYPEGREVDHQALIAKLEADWPDGWALSTSAAALRDVLPLCPPSVRVCAWRRRTRPTPSRRPLSAWEPLLVVGGRELPTERPQDVLDVLDYRGRYDAFPGALVGMKPPEFAVWMFAQLGARAGDELADLFPGSGAITRAWELYTSLGPNDVERDASRAAAAERDASPVDALATRDASLSPAPATRDVSPSR